MNTMTDNAAIDPDWPGDLSIEEEMAERQRLRAQWWDDYELVRDAVGNALDDDMMKFFAYFSRDHVPNITERTVIGDMLSNRLEQRVEAYIEHELR